MAQLLIWLEEAAMGEFGRAPPIYERPSGKAGGSQRVSRVVQQWAEAWWWQQRFPDFIEEENEVYFEEESRYAGGRKKKDPLRIAEAIGNQVVHDLNKAFAPFCGDVKERVDEWLEETWQATKAQPRNGPMGELGASGAPGPADKGGKMSSSTRRRTRSRTRTRSSPMWATWVGMVG